MDHMETKTLPLPDITKDVHPQKRIRARIQRVQAVIKELTGQEVVPTLADRVRVQDIAEGVFFRLGQDHGKKALDFLLQRKMPVAMSFSNTRDMLTMADIGPHKCPMCDGPMTPARHGGGPLGELNTTTTCEACGGTVSLTLTSIVFMPKVEGE